MATYARPKSMSTWGETAEGRALHGGRGQFGGRSHDGKGGRGLREERGVRIDSNGCRGGSDTRRSIVRHNDGGRRGRWRPREATQKHVARRQVPVDEAAIVEPRDRRSDVAGESEDSCGRMASDRLHAGCGSRCPQRRGRPYPSPSIGGRARRYALTVGPGTSSMKSLRQPTAQRRAQKGHEAG